MQEYHKGQKFYYIDTGTHKKVYITLLGIKDDTLYFEGLKGKKYAVNKEYVNKTVFVSLIEDKPKRSNNNKSRQSKDNNITKNLNSKPMYSNGNLDENLGKYATKSTGVNQPKSKKKRRKKKAVVVPDADRIVLPAYVPSKYAGNHHRSARPKGQSMKAVKQYEALGKAGLQKEDDWSKYDNKIPKW